MADRIKSMRQQLFEAIQARGLLLMLIFTDFSLLLSRFAESLLCNFFVLDTLSGLQAHLVTGVTLSNRSGCLLLPD